MLPTYLNFYFQENEKEKESEILKKKKSPRIQQKVPKVSQEIVLLKWSAFLLLLEASVSILLIVKTVLWLPSIYKDLEYLDGTGCDSPTQEVLWCPGQLYSYCNTLHLIAAVDFTTSSYATFIIF